MGNHAHDRWKQQNDMVQRAEEDSGVTERKAETGKARWSMPRCETGLKRGRPPKPVGELSAQYRHRKESKAHREQTIQELGCAKGAEKHRAWLAEQRAASSDTGRRMTQRSITAYAVPMGRGQLDRDMVHTVPHTQKVGCIRGVCG